MHSSTPSRLSLLLPGWLALLFYLPTLGHSYVWDDTYFLTDLPYLRDPQLWWQALREPLFVSQNYFRPLPLLMFALEAQVPAPGAFVFHLVNVLLHVVNTTLVVALARGVLPARGRNLWLASLAGLVFALHPALVENVSWISDRFDLLMASLLLAALLGMQRMAATWRRDLMLALCLFGALLCKETGIVLLLLLPLWQVFLLLHGGAHRSEIRPLLMAQRNLQLYALLALSVLLYLGLRYAALGFLYRSDAQMVGGTLLQHALLTGKTLGWYVLLLLFPFGQTAPVHPAVTPLALNDLQAWGGLAVCVLLVLPVVYQAWHGRAGAVLALLLMAALAPVANLLPLTIGDNLVHDRYLIMPIALGAVLLVLCLCSVWPRAVLALTAVWLLAAAVAVVTTLPHWESNLSLWSWAYAKHPESRIASGNYLLALVDAGRNEEAVALGRQLLSTGRVDAVLRQNLALALLRKGELHSAETEIKAALDLPRKDDVQGRYTVSEALNLLAHIQMQQARWAAAESNLQEAIRLTPYLPRPHYNLALLNYRQGRIETADAALQLALRYAAPEQADVFRREAARVRLAPH